MRLVLATGNPGKLREFAALLAPWDVEVVAQAEFTSTGADENGLSFVENALLKARHAAGVSGLPAVADDSGLEVDALNGGPGIHSARYAGPAASDADNRCKLLQELASIPGALRTARYRCALVYVRSASDPLPVVCESSWDGRILSHPRGEGGFGYDPLFEIAGLGSTAAELPAAEKNRLSHRGQALHALVRELKSQGELGNLCTGSLVPKG